MEDTINISITTEIKEFVAAYTPEEKDKLQALALICRAKTVAPTRPRHGQRVGQYIYNNMIVNNTPTKSSSLSCLFYSTDTGKSLMILERIAGLAEKALLDMEKTNV